MPGILKDCNAERASRGEVVRHINTFPDHLPPPDTKRWTAPRKASVVAAVLSRRITVEEVCQRYDLAVGFAHHQAPELPLFAPEKRLRQRSTLSRFGGSNEHSGRRGRSVWRREQFRT